MNILYKIYNKIIRKFVSTFNLGSLLQRKDAISVLTYHGIQEAKNSVNDYCFIAQDIFDQQMKYLSENFEVKSPENAFIDSYTNKKPVAVITFDDGFMNNYRYALPILKKYNLPATVFLSTGFVDTNDTIWFCKIIDIIESCNQETIDWNGESINIKTPSDKKLASSKIQSELKSLHPKLIDEKIEDLMRSVSREKNYLKTPYEMLNRHALDAMTKSKLITFGAHTYSHAILSRISVAEAEVEVKKSLKDVERFTGKRCNLFAYPNGGVDDYGEYHKSFLKELGVSLVFSMKHGVSSKNDDYKEIKRLFISSHFNMKQFSAQVHGY